MKYFSDVNGLICWVNENGESNHPAISNQQQKIKLHDERIVFLNSDGTVLDEFILWKSLTSLAIAIEKTPKVPVDESLDVDTAASIAHQIIEDYRFDWHKGIKEKPEFYPVRIESGNTGIFFEQMASAIATCQDED